MKSSTIAVSLALGLFVLASTAQAALVAGPLDAVEYQQDPSALTNRKGKLYIPITTLGSGRLGDVYAVDKKHRKTVGFNVDTIRLTGKGATASGSVTTELDFSIEATLGPDSNPVLKLTFNDLDLLPDKGRKGTLTETLSLALQLGETSLPAFTLDGTNYGNYRPDGFGKTNRTRTTYTIPLSDLGLTEAGFNEPDYDFLNATKLVNIHMTLDTLLVRTARGSSLFKNTQEVCTSSLEYVPFQGPEPATMALLALGVPMLLRRRK